MMFTTGQRRRHSRWRMLFVLLAFLGFIRHCKPAPTTTATSVPEATDAEPDDSTPDELESSESGLSDPEPSEQSESDDSEPCDLDEPEPSDSLEPAEAVHSDLDTSDLDTSDPEETSDLESSTFRSSEATSVAAEESSTPVPSSSPSASSVSSPSSSAPSSTTPRKMPSTETPSSTKKAQELGSPSELAWQAWLLVDAKNGAHAGSDSANLLRRITPKSVFIAPALPACAEGYRADTMGRCVKNVNINQEAHIDFLLQRLNALYANRADSSDMVPDLPSPSNEQKESSGPLQLNIPIVSSSNSQSEEILYEIHTI